MKSHADALGPLDRAARASSSKCMTLLRKSCADHAEQTDFVAYFHKTWGHKPDEWVRGVRDVPHAQQDTTAACEGYHSAIKGNELAGKSRLQGRRVETRIRYKQACKAAGFGSNRRKEQAVSKAVRAVQDIPDIFVTMLDSTTETAQVTSMQDICCKYQVTNAGTANASCTCPEDHSGIGDKGWQHPRGSR
ncbi:TPA: hypothetical protein ACH3X1_012507 [Trebouxia sp. C0004]